MFTHYGEIGKNDGSFVRWQTHNPREFLWSLRESDPSVDDDDLLATFREQLLQEENREYLLGVLDYFFINMSRRWREEKAAEPAAQPEAIRHERKTQRQATTALVKAEIMENAKALVLMDLLLPHGKTLADSTGSEYTMLGRHVGKWLTLIGKEVPNGKLVGKTLTEAKVRELYAAV